MRRIVVTGGCGYVGSHVAKYLFESGYEPVVLDLLAKPRKWTSGGWQLVTCDVTDYDHVLWELDRVKPEAVIHLAASSEVGPSYTDPLAYYDNNVRGMRSVLAACRDAHVDRVVFSSTSSVYGTVDKTDLPTTENQAKLPETSYGSSKLCCEHMLRDVDRAHGIRSVSLRYFNASGASSDGSIGEYRERPTHLIPSLLAVYNQDTPEFTINGDDFNTLDGTAVRDYCHVWDIASAHVAALRYLESGATTAINIGSGHGTSVREVIDVFQEAVGIELPVVVGARRPGDIPENFADISLAEQVLQWRPTCSNIQTIVADALGWNNSNKFKLIRALDSKKDII